MSQLEKRDPQSPEESANPPNIQALVAEVEKVESRAERILNVGVGGAFAVLAAVALASSWHPIAKWGVGITSLMFTTASVSFLFETKESKLRGIQSQYGSDVLEQVMEQLVINETNQLLAGGSLTQQLQERVMKRLEEKLSQEETKAFDEAHQSSDAAADS